VDWIHVTQDRVQRWADHVNSRPFGSIKTGNFVSSLNHAFQVSHFWASLYLAFPSTLWLSPTLRSPTRGQQPNSSSCLGVRIVNMERSVGRWCVVEFGSVCAWKVSLRLLSSVSDGVFLICFVGLTSSCTRLRDADDCLLGCCAVWSSRYWPTFRNCLLPQLKRSVAGFSPRRPGFAPSSVHVEFVVDTVALNQVFLRVLRFYPVSMIPPLLHIHPYVWGMDKGPVSGRSSTERVSPHRNVRASFILCIYMLHVISPPVSIATAFTSLLCNFFL
jgi:hypothetical protein